MLNNFFFCAGPPRSGTTWIYEMMQDHPDLHFPAIKEVNYFLHKYNNMPEPILTENFRIKQFIEFIRDDSNQHDPTGIIDSMDWWKHYLDGPIDDDWYFKLFDGAASGQWCADFSPATLHTLEDGWNCIKKIPSVKMIIISRDPIERCWSGFKTKMEYWGHEDILHGLTREEFNYLPEKVRTYRRTILSTDIMSIEKITKRILTHLTEDNFKVYEFTEIMNNPIGMLKSIEDFVGIRNIDYRNNPFLDMSPNPSSVIKMPDWFMDESL